MRNIRIAMRLALRNLKRNRKRTALTTTGMSIGLVVMMMSLGMMDGITRQSVQSMVDYDIAHVRGYTKGYMDQDVPSLDYIIQNADQLRDEVSSQKGITSTLRFSIPGKLIYGSEEAFMNIVGLDLVHESEVFKTLESLIEGEVINGSGPGVMIGKKLAKSFELNIGDRVTLLARSAPGAFNTLRLPIKGILYTGHSLIDANSVFISMDEARNLAIVDDGATEIDVLSRSEKYAEKLAGELRQKYPEYEWQTWKEAASGFLTHMQFKKFAQGIIIAILALVAAVAVANTMVMAVHERTMEIGALRAMGFEKGMISRMFLFEGLFIGLIAGIIGVSIGSSLVLYLGNVGISLAAYEDIDIGYPIANAMYPMLTFASVMYAFMFGLFMTTIASWGAARKAAKGEVVRALREGML